MIRILKVTMIGGKTAVTYAADRQSGKGEQRTVRSEEEPLDAFADALDALRQPLGLIMEHSKKWMESVEITGLVLTDKTIVIKGKRKRSGIKAPFSVRNPAILLHQASEEAGEGEERQLSLDELTGCDGMGLLEEVCDQAIAFVRGFRKETAQMQLDLPDAFPGDVEPTSPHEKGAAA